MSLDLYIGPMYAGKTTKLIHMFQENKSPQKVVVDFSFKPHKKIQIADLKNHDDVKLQNVYTTQNLSVLANETSYDNDDFDYYSKFSTTKHIYINECQFFPDLKYNVLTWLNKGICVYLYGLDSDYKMEIFGQTTLLIPYCNHIEKIKGICSICKNPSIVSYRTTNDTRVFLPHAEYIPLCLKCRSSI
tara:strand:+ start:777 stop:1340 length:564 start_codon:yes stop_codon:yes gene_type:complete